MVQVAIGLLVCSYLAIVMVIAMAAGSPAPSPPPETEWTNMKKCDWREDENGAWQTECKHLFEFINDGPEENKFKFCPFCGGALFFVHLGRHHPVPIAPPRREP